MQNEAFQLFPAVFSEVGKRTVVETSPDLAPISFSSSAWAKKPIPIPPTYPISLRQDFTLESPLVSNAQQPSSLSLQSLTGQVGARMPGFILGFSVRS